MAKRIDGVRVASLAQRLERSAVNRKVAGSNPAGTVNFDIVAEWSKATDSSSVIFGCAGSNPADVTFLKY